MKKFGGFVIGVIVTVVSMVVGLFIFVGKIIHRGNKTMPWTTKRYIKDQFTFVDISKVKSAVANSIKAFIDWLFFGKETPYFKHRDTYYGNKNESVYKSYKPKTKTVKPVPYFIDIDEYGCGHIEIQLRYDLSTGKLYDDYDDEEVTSCDFIKDMLKAEDPCLIEPGNYVYIHDPRDGTDYEIDIVEHVDRDEEDVDESKDKAYLISRDDLGGKDDNLYNIWYMKYLKPEDTLIYLDDRGNTEIDISNIGLVKDSLIHKMLKDSDAGRKFYIRQESKKADYVIIISLEDLNEFIKTRSWS